MNGKSHANVVCDFFYLSQLFHNFAQLLLSFEELLVALQLFTTQFLNSTETIRVFDVDF